MLDPRAGLLKSVVTAASHKTDRMTDTNIKNKQGPIQQLRELAEKEPAWREKNHLLFA